MESSDLLFSKANDEFVNENYENAIDLFTEAISCNGSKGVYYLNRAHAYFKLGDYEKALSDTERCLSLATSEKAFLRKGICQFELKHYKDALETFQKGKELNAKNDTFEVWLNACREKLGLPEPNEAISNSHCNQNSTTHQLKSVETAVADTTSEPAVADPTPEPAVADPTPEPAVTTPTSEPAVAAPTSEAVAKSQAPKFEWYQTQSHTVITVLIKKLKEEDVKADYGAKTFHLLAKFPSDEDDYELDLHLAHEIIPDESQTKVTPSKIEIKLKKRDGIHWNKLEGDSDSNVKPVSMSVPQGCEQKPVTRNWDKFVKDVVEMEKTETPEGDAALNHLFQQIYADGSDDVKRAMVKSFYESGGTVLSTNWSEVGEKAVDVKPPSGMEYKQWET